MTKTILVVEDDEEVRETASAMLRAIEFAVLGTRNADEAAALLEGGTRADGVLTDVMMPGTMDGFQFAGWVRRKFPHIRVVCTSGYPNARRISDDCDVFIPKPFRFHDLARAFETLLTLGNHTR